MLTHYKARSQQDRFTGPESHTAEEHMKGGLQTLPRSPKAMRIKVEMKVTVCRPHFPHTLLLPGYHTLLLSPPQQGHLPSHLFIPSAWSTLTPSSLGQPFRFLIRTQVESHLYRELLLTPPPSLSRLH